MTSAVRIALIIAALPILAVAGGIAVYADGWFRWVLALAAVGVAAGCIKGASEANPTSSSKDISL